MSLLFELRRPQHAIGEFSAIVDFFQPVSQPTFTIIAASMAVLADRFQLPAPIPVQAFQLAMNNGTPALQPAAGMGGVGFQRFAPTGEAAESLQCDAKQLSYASREYSTWAEMLPRLLEVLSALMPLYLREVPAVTSIRLQYINEFRARSPLTKQVNELLRAGNRWVGAAPLTSDEPWHSHLGTYVQVQGGRRVLVNVNCDITRTSVPVPSPEERLLALVTITSGVYYNTPRLQPLVLSLENSRAILERDLINAHEVEKDVLREVISDEYLAAMGAGHAY